MTARMQSDKCGWGARMQFISHDDCIIETMADCLDGTVPGSWCIQWMGRVEDALYH